MDIALLILITICCVVVAQKEFPRKKHYDLRDAPELFEKFMQVYHKEYKDEKEIGYRYANFIDSLMEINRHNEKFGPENMLGITEFADLTYEEFVACCTEPGKNMTDIESESCDPGARRMRQITKKGKKVCQMCECHKNYGWGCQVSNIPCEWFKYCRPGVMWLKPKTINGKKECHKCHCGDDKEWRCKWHKDGQCKRTICKKGGLKGNVKVKPCIECSCDDDDNLVCGIITDSQKGKPCQEIQSLKMEMVEGWEEKETDQNTDDFYDYPPPDEPIGEMTIQL